MDISGVDAPLSISHKTIVLVSSDHTTITTTTTKKASREEYFQTHNPALVLDQIARPTVYINAYDVRALFSVLLGAFPSVACCCFYRRLELARLT